MDDSRGDVRLSLYAGPSEVIEISKREHPGVPIINHTGYHKKQQGADYLLEKPVGLSSLQEALAHVMR